MFKRENQSKRRLRCWLLFDWETSDIDDWFILLMQEEPFNEGERKQRGDELTWRDRAGKQSLWKINYIKQWRVSCSRTQQQVHQRLCSEQMEGEHGVDMADVPLKYEVNASCDLSVQVQVKSYRATNIIIYRNRKNTLVLLISLCKGWFFFLDSPPLPFRFNSPFLHIFNRQISLMQTLSYPLQLFGWISIKMHEWKDSC